MPETSHSTSLSSPPTPGASNSVTLSPARSRILMWTLAVVLTKYRMWVLYPWARSTGFGQLYALPAGKNPDAVGPTGRIVSDNPVLDGSCMCCGHGCMGGEAGPVASVPVFQAYTYPSS